MKISQTYQIVTHETEEFGGDFADSGFDFQAEEYSFRDLVQYIRRNGFSRQGSTPWLSNNAEADFRTGDRDEKSLHFDRENHPRLKKYWEKAVALAAK